MVEYAQENQIRYINFLNLTEDVGLDFQTDTYDGGLHLNLSGAEKLSKYFGRILKEEYGLSDHHNDSELVKVWEEKSDFYNQMKARQEQELGQNTDR